MIAKEQHCSMRAADACLPIFSPIARCAQPAFSGRHFRLRLTVFAAAYMHIIGRSAVSLARRLPQWMRQASQCPSMATILRCAPLRRDYHDFSVAAYVADAVDEDASAELRVPAAEISRLISVHDLMPPRSYSLAFTRRTHIFARAES